MDRFRVCCCAAIALRNGEIEESYSHGYQLAALAATVTCPHLGAPEGDAQASTRCELEHPALQYCTGTVTRVVVDVSALCSLISAAAPTATATARAVPSRFGSALPTTSSKQVYASPCRSLTLAALQAQPRACESQESHLYIIARNQTLTLQHVSWALRCLTRKMASRAKFCSCERATRLELNHG